MPRLLGRWSKAGVGWTDRPVVDLHPNNTHTIYEDYDGTGSHSDPIRRTNPGLIEYWQRLSMRVDRSHRGAYIELLHYIHRWRGSYPRIPIQDVQLRLRYISVLATSTTFQREWRRRARGDSYRPMILDPGGDDLQCTIHDDLPRADFDDSPSFQDRWILTVKSPDSQHWYI